MERALIKKEIEEIKPGGSIEFIGYRETMIVARSDQGVLRADGIMMELNQAANWVATIRPIAVAEVTL